MPDVLKEFYERLSEHRHDSSYYASPVGIERRRKILAGLTLGPRSSICDIGCGDGMIAVRIGGQQRTVFGVDLALGRAKRAAQAGVDACVADGLALPFPSNRFDGVICTEVIEHVRHPKTLANEIKRVLAPGGVAMVSSPYDQTLRVTLNDISPDDLQTLSYEALREKYRIENSHLSSFTVESLSQLFNDDRCEVVDVDYTYDFDNRFGALSRLVLAVYRRGIASNSRLPRVLRYHPVWDRLLVLLSRRQSHRHHIILAIQKRK